MNNDPTIVKQLLAEGKAIAIKRKMADTNQAVAEQIRAANAFNGYPAKKEELTFAALSKEKQALEDELLVILKEFTERTGLRIAFIDIANRGSDYDNVSVEACLP